MSGIFPFISGPPQGSVLPRRAILTGGVSPFNGAVNSAEIQFGVGGPTFNITNPNGGFALGWSGTIPKEIRAGQAFQIIIRAAGTMLTNTGPEPDAISVDGESAWNYTLENVVPSVTVNPFQTPAATTQATYLLSLGGSTSVQNLAIYGVPQVQCRVDNGAFVNASMSFPAWTAQIQVPPGTHQITIQAVDQFGTVAAIERAITVLQYPIPASPAGAKRTPAGIPTSASVTSWTRLEPQVANADIGLSSNARLFDPLWLMTRQFQMGEFQAEDTGSPVQARLRATTAPLTRCFMGELPLPPDGVTPTPQAAPGYDPTRTPLESVVERRRMRPATDTDPRMLKFVVDAGLHFLRMIELNALAKKYRPAFLAAYLLPSVATVAGDDGARRFVQAMVGRAPDARRLAAAFRPTMPAIVFDPGLKIAVTDLTAVQQVATAWLAWYDTLFAEPASAADDAWTPARLEYAVSVSTRLSTQAQDAVTLSASEFDGGRLDWSSFDVNTKLTVDTTGDNSFRPLNETTVPTPVNFPGAPAPRFWEIEDAKIAYGLVAAGPTDLAHLLMVEYASTYGNDWFVVPVNLPVGSVTRVESLVVTDTFGVRTLVRPIGDPTLAPPFFSLWQQTTKRFAGDTFGPPVANRFFLPPTLGQTIDGPVVEDVLFMRDEMANLAWGIERSIEGAVEIPVPLTATATTATTAVVPTPGTEAYPHYQLASPVAENWIPLLPVQLTDQPTGKLLSWLKRGALLQPSGQPKAHLAQGEVLATLRNGLLYDEEVPREGVHITRRRRMTRWTDGSSWVWSALRNEIGSGEGSAGLQFDQLLASDTAAAAAAHPPAAPPTIGTPAMAPASFTIGSPGGTFTVTLANTGAALLGVTLQGWLVQGTTRRVSVAETPLDCKTGSGVGVLPNGTFSISGVFAVAATGTGTGVGSGTGTLVPGEASLELQLKQGATVLATTTTPGAVTLVSNVPPSIGALTVSAPFVFIGASFTDESATVVNPGASRSNIVLQGWITQGAARRAAGGAMVSCGAAAGVLPSGTFTIPGSISTSNTAGGTGTLVPGAATFELQLLENGTGLGTRTIGVSLQPATPGIAALSSSSSAIQIGGAVGSYSATLRNPGANLSNVVLQGYLVQGATRHAAGGIVVIAGAGNGVLPTGFSNVGFSISASNTIGGIGTLVSGPATFELQMTMNDTLLELKTIPVVLA